jgi:hypothetical protein
LLGSGNRLAASKQVDRLHIARRPWRSDPATCPSPLVVSASASVLETSAMTTATVTIFVIAILIVAAIAWNAFGGRRDLDRRRQGGRDPGAPD